MKKGSVNSEGFRKRNILDDMGTSNDENLVRDFFNKADLSAKVTDLDRDLIEECAHKIFKILEIRCICGFLPRLTL